MFKFRIRDLIWLTIVVAFALVITAEKLGRASAIGSVKAELNREKELTEALRSELAYATRRMESLKMQRDYIWQIRNPKK